MDSEIIQLEDGWQKEIKTRAIEPLQRMLNDNFEGNTKLFSNREYVEIYTILYKMCTQRSPYNWSEQLYQRHGETIANYLTNTVLPALREKHDQFLLQELVLRWNNHKIMNTWMQKFFMYLDRYYVKYHHLPVLADAGMRHFKVLVFDVIKKDAVSALLELINLEREGQTIDQAIIKQCIELFEAMGMGSLDAYKEDFEEPMCASTREYYARKAQEWIQTDTTSTYLEKAERAIEAEKRRVAEYLLSESERPLLDVIQEELLHKREMELLDKENSGLRWLLANDKTEDLHRMFRLFSRLPDQVGLHPIAEVVKQHILMVGNEKVEQRLARIESEKETNQDPTFIRDLLAVHDKYMDMVTVQFEGNNLFQRALKHAFVEIVNKEIGKIKTAELMSSFCDRLLKTGGERLSDDEIEEYLDKVVQLFSYLTDKDLFSEIYRNQLGKRLLNQRSSSDDLERSMIGRLKMRCGAQFTGKMEGMMNDLALAADQLSAFKKWTEEQNKRQTDLDFSVLVLTTGYWPTYKALDVSLPPSMLRCVQTFNEYYAEKTNHRRLAWVHSLGNGTVRATWDDGKFYEFTVVTLQAIVMVAFNSFAEPVTFETIAEHLQLAEEPLKRVLHSLSCGRYKVLLKEPENNSVRPGDVFRRNATFSSQKRKIMLPMAQLEESHNPKRVEEDRSIAIEAAVVRIMKARKTLPHQQLVGEVLTQLSFFQPNPKLIKKRIEALIDREYLEREPDNPNTYRYLA